MTKRQKRTDKWFDDRGNTCFYSGFICDKAGLFVRSIEHLLPHPWMAGVEHIGRGKTLHRKNKVVATDFINQKIDVAPLQVKFALKEHLSKWSTPTGDAAVVKTKLLEQVDRFISTYEINGYLPWNYRDGVNVERCTGLRSAYEELILPEEKRLLNLKEHNNKKMFLANEDVSLLITTISKVNTFVPPYQKYLIEGS